MKKLFALTLASIMGTFTFAACVGPNEDDQEGGAEDEVEAEEADELDDVDQLQDAAPAAGTIIPKCGKKERWCACGGCTPIELKCNPYCNHSPD